ncbi:MAG: TrmB family transcriptional regulator [Halolamina sp.]
MMQTQMQAERTATVPEGLDSPRAKLVYLYLSANGASTVGELQDGLGMKKISLFSILKTLRKESHVGQTGDRYAVA